MRFLAAPALVMAMLAPTPSAAEPAHGDLAVALGVLHSWDDRRAHAWAQEDVVALRSLYVPGCEASRADVRLLRGYRARGLVVRRLVTQVFAVRVLHRGPRTLRLRIVDRVAGGVVVMGGNKSRLPSSRPVTRTVSFRLTTGAWRVAEVSDPGRAPRAGRR